MLSGLEGERRGGERRGGERRGGERRAGRRAGERANPARWRAAWRAARRQAAPWGRRAGGGKWCRKTSARIVHGAVLLFFSFALALFAFFFHLFWPWCGFGLFGLDVKPWL